MESHKKCLLLNEVKVASWSRRKALAPCTLKPGSARFDYRLRITLPVSGGYRDKVTPDPISNSEVKLVIADGTARVTVWESRTPPDLF